MFPGPAVALLAVLFPPAGPAGPSAPGKEPTSLWLTVTPDRVEDGDFAWSFPIRPCEFFKETARSGSTEYTVSGRFFPLGRWEYFVGALTLRVRKKGRAFEQTDVFVPAVGHGDSSADVGVCLARHGWDVQLSRGRPGPETRPEWGGVSDGRDTPAPEVPAPPLWLSVTPDTEGPFHWSFPVQPGQPFRETARNGGAEYTVSGRILPDGRGGWFLGILSLRTDKGGVASVREHTFMLGVGGRDSSAILNVGAMGSFVDVDDVDTRPHVWSVGLSRDEPGSRERQAWHALVGRWPSYWPASPADSLERSPLPQP
jgi:hypothetical protein